MRLHHLLCFFHIISGIEKCNIDFFCLLRQRVNRIVEISPMSYSHYTEGITGDEEPASPFREFSAAETGFSIKSDRTHGKNILETPLVVSSLRKIYFLREHYGSS